MSTVLKRFDVRVSLGYCAVAILWIVLSDRTAAALFSGNPPLLASVSEMKGIGYVLITTLGLFMILRREVRKHERLEQRLQRDIDERAKTMEALQKSERRFASIFHGSPVPTGISRLGSGELVDVNDALLRASGYTRDEVIGKTSTELGLWVTPGQRTDILETLGTSGAVQNFEVVGRTKTGEAVYGLATAQLLELGDELHMVSMFYDVTEQKKLEEQIRYQALLLENVSDAVISTDVNLNIRSWNPAAETIYGWKAEEVVGKPVTAIIHGKFLQTTAAEALEELQSKGSWRGETIHEHKDGSMVHVLASTSFVSDSGGNVLGVVSVNRDITARVQAQEKMQEAEHLKLELEKEKDLIQLKERFISVVSHEFRTPLSVIMSSAELVQKFHTRMPEERQLEHIQVILLQAEFMVSLLEDVLTVNKARAGRLEFKPMPLDLIRFCQETLERIQVLDKTDHEFVFEHTGNLTDLKLDAKLLQHILVNLLSNAVKYSPNGGAVKLESKREGEEIVLRVSDHGIGIPSDGMAHLFDVFYRATNTGEIGGTGLGLAIAKESAELHGGTIRCESELGVGTTFTVRLPIRA